MRAENVAAVYAIVVFGKPRARLLVTHPDEDRVSKVLTHPLQGIRGDP